MAPCEPKITHSVITKHNLSILHSEIEEFSAIELDSLDDAEEPPLENFKRLLAKRLRASNGNSPPQHTEATSVNIGGVRDDFTVQI